MIGSNFTKLFLVALFVKSLIESLLDKRNLDHIVKNRNFLPDRFKNQITIEEHQKAADYSIQKIKVSQIFHFINLVIFLALTLGGGIELLTRVSLSFAVSDKIAGLVFFGLLGITTFVLSLPEQIYTTFFLEEKFGFNKTTPKLFLVDIIKGAVLTILLGGPIAYVILLIMENLNQSWWLYSFIFLSIVQLLLIFIFPTWIAPLFNKFTELPDGEIKTTIVNLLERVGFKNKGIFIMDASKRSSHGNAYFTGFGKNKRIVFFDTLIKSLDPEEIEAVLAHELGHMKKKHILKGIIKSFLFSFIGFWILGQLKNNPLFFNGHGISTLTNANILTLFSMVAGTYTFLLTPLSAWLSRKNEYEADEFAAQNASGKKLISALVKMYNDNKSFLLPDPLYSKFYYSHPPAQERINYLESLTQH
jgi:STE24 endopeptidase